MHPYPCACMYKMLNPPTLTFLVPYTSTHTGVHMSLIHHKHSEDTVLLSPKLYLSPTIPNEQQPTLSGGQCQDDKK
jgi:hypothetical protein